MSHATRWCLRTALLLIAGAVLPSAVSAQEIQWRFEYKKAREEAVQKGLPLIIEFGSENCFWCKQLDTRTFHDEAVIGLLNEHCIPLKIDATKQIALAEACASRIIRRWFSLDPTAAFSAFRKVSSNRRA